MFESGSAAYRCGHDPICWTSLPDEPETSAKTSPRPKPRTRDDGQESLEVQWAAGGRAVGATRGSLRALPGKARGPQARTRPF